jgi:hypothetical protein
MTGRIRKDSLGTFAGGAKVRAPAFLHSARKGFWAVS